MRMRYRQVTYRYTNGSQKQVEQHYRQLFNEVLRQSQQPMMHHSWRPQADIFESATHMTVKVELAGMSEEDIDVTLYEDALIISGERLDEASERDEQDVQENVYYHEAQIRYGPFRVEVFLSSPIRRDEVTAVYENGFLRVNLPKQTERSHTQSTQPTRVRNKDTRELL
jgi:HSP20 family molecular chaperone IbpA